MTDSAWPSREPLPLSCLARIDRISDEFERQWKAGQQPRIEDCWQAADPDDRQHLLRELLILEWEFRGEAGQQPGLEEYRQRFPQQAAVVEAAWAECGRLREASEISTEDFAPAHDTSAEQPDPLPPDQPPPAEPDRIGRYQITRRLGRGGFAEVYLAHDPDLDRQVALKVSRRDRFRHAADLEIFVAEARKTVQLEHPRIVRIHDVQREPGLVYIVQQYIAGQDLSKYARSNRLSVEQIVDLMIGVVEAVGFAHQRGVVHRDLKPANILIDRTGQPYVADFGLALHVDERHQHRHEWAGSAAYMSPEQVRREAHRLDGRSDIWSLGVILYELLGGRRPFSGSDRELFEEIESRDPRPLREINPSIPREVARICLNCLAKQKVNRYETAADLIDDLRHWRDGKPSPVVAAAGELSAGSVPESPAEDGPGSVQIVPKGLRSFDAGDADFFLQLLPGPHDREGLPSSIRWWKTKIEETDPDETFAVGVMYGPSGCGKSSRVKAALLPRLSGNVLPLYVEATAADTEVRLLKTLRKRCPELAGDASLPEVFAQLRNRGGSRGRKVLVVLDQFEQWLHACDDYGGSQLVRALRQCDGSGVQALVLIRADFWMAVTRFMQTLEIPLVEGRNQAVVDLFDPDHAQKVLAAFGRAYGRLPDSAEAITAEQQRFLEFAVEDLAEDHKVICVRLAVFADMMKGRPWIEASLSELGGAEGVGVRFLDESFTAQTAPPSHRRHEKAARAVLQELLPEQGSDIKGQMKPYQSLLQASGYADRPGDFDTLLAILNNELRLITPTEPDQMAAGDMPDAAPAPDAKHYQLTHDYLAPSLRTWLTREKGKTRRGRAGLRLAERAALWHAKEENQQLPSWWEYLSIRALTDSAKWSERERTMMRRADRVQGVRFLGTVCLLIAALMSGVIGIRESRRFVAVGYVEQLLKTTADGVPPFIELTRPLKSYAIPMLRASLDDVERSASERLHAACALAEFGECHFEFPFATLRDVSGRECSNVVGALKNISADWSDSLDRAIKEAHDKGDWPFKARLSIVALYLGKQGYAGDMLEFENRPDPIQRTIFIDTLPDWHADLALLRQRMTDAEQSGLRSGICLALGSIEDVDQTARSQWEPILKEWYTRQPDTGTHGAAGWTLRQWQVPLPEISASTEPVNERQWYVNSVGMTMLRIAEGKFVRIDEDDPDPNAKPHEDTLTGPFFLSDREVSVGLFQRFVDDADYKHEKPIGWTGAETRISPTPDHPVQTVRWYDAVKFCNWLSRREDRKPCYELKAPTPGVGETSDENWEVISAANGYRLPTENEWEYACRAGTETAFTFGDDESLLGKYAVFLASATQPIGSRLPNAWGLFDMHGNIWEWCQDQHEVGVGSEVWGSARVNRGGSWILHRQELPVGIPSQEPAVVPGRLPGLPPCPQFRRVSSGPVRVQLKRAEPVAQAEGGSSVA